MEVTVLGGENAVYRPRWALVEYEAKGHPPRLAVWRLGEDGEARALYRPDPRWLRSLLRRLEKEQEVEWIPERLLARSEKGMAWWRPAWPAPMHFTLPALKELSGKSFPQPPLLFLLRGKSVHLFALPEDRRPGPNTPLLLAPYPNYYPERGWVCWGDGPVPEGQDLEAWESAFFQSAFSHAAGNPLKRGTLSELWQNLQGKKRFPTRQLKPAGLTAGKAVARILGG